MLGYLITNTQLSLGLQTKQIVSLAQLITNLSLILVVNIFCPFKSGASNLSNHDGQELWKYVLNN